MMLRAAVVTVVVIAATMPLTGRGSEAPACRDDPRFAALDFWLGGWQVFTRGAAGGEVPAGENTIEKVLAGCAVTETWRAATGRQGMSLFYLEPVSGEWRQVWVTDGALGGGGVKEKRLVEHLPDGGLRFEGQVPLNGGGHYRDRTTLTPLPGGDVRQLIEVSTDGDSGWQPVFDGHYVRIE